jgi:Flp pilus assembly protein CpaB
VYVSQFSFVKLAPDAVEPDAFSGDSETAVREALEAAIAGKWFLYPVPAAQQIRSTMLVSTGELSVPLTVDERLISITARASNAVSGSIRPGSLVDVYVSDSDGLTGVLGQRVEIVAVSLLPEQFESVAQQQFNDPAKTLSDFVSTQPVGGTYVIRVRAGDVARYIAADTAGKITLALQGTDAATFSPTPTDLRGTICGGSPDPICLRDGQ